jgi:hypothetical protein
MSIEEIVANIDVRIAALTSEIQPLLGAKAALLDGAPTLVRPYRPRIKPEGAAATVATVEPEPEPEAEAEAPKPARKPRSRATSPRRRRDAVPAGKLVSLLGASEGLTATALAKEAGGEVAQVRVLLKELSDAGQVRRTGQRRATRWHIVTDEDRIAKRAAEIEAQSHGHAGGKGKAVAAHVAS